MQTDEKHPGYEKKNESKIVPRAAAELVHDKFVQKVNATAKQWYSAQDMLITGFLHESLPAEFALLSRSGSTGWTVVSVRAASTRLTKRGILLITDAERPRRLG